KLSHLSPRSLEGLPRLDFQRVSEVARQVRLHRRADTTDIKTGLVGTCDFDALQPKRAVFVLWCAKDDNVERVAQSDALPRNVQRAASRKSSADPQPSVFPVDVRLFEIGKVAPTVRVAADVTPSFLREELLGQHSLERSELNVQLHRQGGEAEQQKD